ncbi:MULTISPECIES: hypothetical protein [Actinomycetes]|uniref:hypothetical protein n=1 Tax=Micromonospora sp. NPDC005367 TaxID=3155590 RepID=UPI0033BAAA6F
MSGENTEQTTETVNPADSEQVTETVVETPPEGTTATDTTSDAELPEWAREKIAKANREAANLRKRLKEAEPAITAAQAAKDAQMTELDKANERLTAADQRAEKFRDRAIRGEAKALAADFANPDVAVRLLGDLTGYVDDDGEIDTARIKSDLTNLLKTDPYLGRVQEQAGMKPNRAQGQSGGEPLSDDQRAKQAQSRGDWKAAAAIKADQLLKLSQQQNH